MGWVQDVFNSARTRQEKVPPHARPQWSDDDMCRRCGIRKRLAAFTICRACRNDNIAEYHDRLT